MPHFSPPPSFHFLPPFGGRNIPLILIALKTPNLQTFNGPKAHPARDKNCFFNYLRQDLTKNLQPHPKFAHNFFFSGEKRDFFVYSLGANLMHVMFIQPSPQLFGKHSHIGCKNENITKLEPHWRNKAKSNKSGKYETQRSKVELRSRCELT